MVYLTGVLSLFALLSCMIDFALILCKSRVYGDLGWGIPSPFSFILVALVSMLLTLPFVSQRKRPVGKSIKIMLFVGSIMMLLDQVVVLADLLAPALWSAMGSPIAMLLLGVGVMLGGVNLLRGGMCASPGKMLALSRGMLFVGGCGVMGLNMLLILGVDQPYVVSMYILPILMICMFSGIIALIFSLRSDVV